jgi:hypothetical protein
MVVPFVLPLRVTYDFNLGEGASGEMVFCLEVVEKEGN